MIGFPWTGILYLGEVLKSEPFDCDGGVRSFEHPPPEARAWGKGCHDTATPFSGAHLLGCYCLSRKYCTTHTTIHKSMLGGARFAPCPGGIVMLTVKGVGYTDTNMCTLLVGGGWARGVLKNMFLRTTQILGRGNIFVRWLRRHPKPESRRPRR